VKIKELASKVSSAKFSSPAPLSSFLFIIKKPTPCWRATSPLQCLLYKFQTMLSPPGCQHLISEAMHSQRTMCRAGSLLEPHGNPYTETYLHICILHRVMPKLFLSLQAVPIKRSRTSSHSVLSNIWYRLWSLFRRHRLTISFSSSSSVSLSFWFTF
jgi:hypothetical protein